ncbi:hypothetical protein FB451DRAFT_699438 [Mycena latifolia]|nr:hypothetical protein FB451DRAFT_699438 [Mycena latifolia]
MRGGGACYGRRRVYWRVAWGGVGYPSNPIPDCSPQTPAALGAHARLLSWFLDAPAAPFGVHRMALAGKAAGKNVGMWFGPSATASAVRSSLSVLLLFYISTMPRSSSSAFGADAGIVGVGRLSPSFAPSLIALASLRWCLWPSGVNAHFAHLLRRSSVLDVGDVVIIVEDDSFLSDEDFLGLHSSA